MSVAASLRQLGVTEQLAIFTTSPSRVLISSKNSHGARRSSQRCWILTLSAFKPFVTGETSSLVFVNLSKGRDKARAEHLVVNEPGRTTFVGAFPIGIDFDEFAQGAAKVDVADRAARDRSGIQWMPCIVLGVDRLDYTREFAEAGCVSPSARCHPALRRKISLIQVVVPSREDIPKYGELKAEDPADSERDQWSPWGTRVDAHSLQQ